MRAFEKLNRISEQFRAIRPLSLAKSVFAACLIAGTISAAGLRLSAEGTKDIGETAITNYKEVTGKDLSNETMPTKDSSGKLDYNGRYYYADNKSATALTDRLANVARWNFRGYTNNETSLFMGVKNQQRFKFYAYAGETVYLASSGKIDAGTNSDGACEAVVEYPDGTKHYIDFETNKGHISTREQEKNGPNGVYLPILTDDRKRTTENKDNVFEGYSYYKDPCDGYEAFKLEIKQSGVYIVDFRTNSTGTASTKMSVEEFDNITGHNISAIDITVAKKGPGDKMYAQSGRVWADAFSTQVDTGMYGYLYTVTRDGYIWRFALNGMNPYTFSMYANARGPIGITTNASAYHSFHSPMFNSTKFDPYAAMVDKNGNADGVLIVSPDNEVSDLDSPYHMFLNYPAPDLPESVAKLTASNMGEVTALRYDGRTGDVDSDEEIDDEENIYGLVGVGGFFETVTTPGTSSYRVVIDMSNMYAVHYHGEVISPGIHYGESGRDSHEEEICLSVPYGTNGAHCDINFVFWDESKSQWYGIFSKVQIGKDGAYDQHPISAPGQDISELVEIRELYSNELNFSGLKNDNPPTLGEDFTVKNGSGEDVVYKCCGKIMLGNAAVDDQVDKLLWNGRDEYGRILPVGYYFGKDGKYPGKVYAEPKAGEVHYPLGDVEHLDHGVAIWLENPPSYIQENVGYLGRDEVTVRSSLFYNNEDKSILRDFLLEPGFMPATSFKTTDGTSFASTGYDYNNKANTSQGNNAWFWNLPSNVGSLTAGEVVDIETGKGQLNREWVKNGARFDNYSLEGIKSYDNSTGKLAPTSTAAFFDRKPTTGVYRDLTAAKATKNKVYWTGTDDKGSDHGVVDIWTHVIGEKYELKNPIELRHEADKVMVTGFVYLEDQANTAGYGTYDTGTNDVALPGAEVTGIYYTYEPGYDYKTDTSSDKVKLPSVISASEIPEGLRPHVYNTVTNTNGIYSIPVDMAEFQSYKTNKVENDPIYKDYYEKIFLVISYTDPSAEMDPITKQYPITHVVSTTKTYEDTERYLVHNNICLQTMSLAAAKVDANNNPMVKKEYVADHVGYMLQSDISNLRIQKNWIPEDYANSSLSAVFKVVGLYKNTNDFEGEDMYSDHNYAIFKQALEDKTYNYLLEGVTVDVARGGSVVLKNLPKSVLTVSPSGGADTRHELVYAVIEEEMGGELTIEHNSAEKIDGVTYDNWVFTNKIDPSTFTETVWFDYNGDKTNNAGNNSADKNKDYLMSEATVRIQMEKDGRWADDFEYIVDETSKDAETITSDTVFTLKNGQKFCTQDGVLTIDGLLPGRYKVIIEFPTGTNYNSAVVFGHEGNDAVVLPTAESDQPEKLNQVVQIVTIPSHGDVKAEVGVGALEGSVDLSEYIDINKTLKHSDGKTDSVNINPEFEFELALKKFTPATTATPENYGDNAADVEGSASIEFDSDKKFGTAYKVAADDFKTKINFKAAGEYVFTLKETPTKDSGVKSDDNSYELTFEVSNDKKSDNTGTELNVKLTKIEKVVSGKTNESVRLNSSGKTALDFVNVYTPGKVTVTVEATGDGKPDDPVFSYTVQIFDADKHAIKGEFPCVKNGTESKIGHNGTFTLKHGESITISELPDGATVTVIETEKNGFTVSHTVNGGDEASSDSVSVDVASGADGEKKIKFINKFETGGLIIAKEVVGTTDKPEFTFNLTLNGSTSSQKIPAFNGNIEVVDSTGKVVSTPAPALSAAAPTDEITKTITIPAGGKATISYIPKGVKVDVTEAAATGYTLTYVEGGSDGKYTGTVAAAAESDYPTATFYNSVPTTAAFSGTKKITGRDWVSAIDNGKYTFTLTAVDGAPMPSSGTTATANNVGQNINFGDITFTEVGTYYYTITEKEVDTSVKGVTKSSEVWYVRATVTEDTSHQLQVKTEYSLKDFNDRVEANRPAADDIKTTFEFTNTYKAAGSDPVSVEVTKNLTGPVEKLSKNFTFTVKEVDKDGVEVTDYTHDPVTITVTGSGENYTGSDKTVTLEDSYTEAGTHYYIITENRGTIRNMNYDSSEYRITVKVTDNNKTAKLDTRVTIEKAGTAWTDPIVFNNAYSVTPVTSAQLTITKNYKTVGGTALAIADGQFSFTANITGDTVGHAKFANNTAGNTVSTSASIGSDTMSLGAITFDRAGTYTLTVAEDAVADTNVVTDPAKTIKFEVEDQNGALAITKTTDGAGEEISDLAAYLTFNNVLTPEPVSTDSPGGTLGDISPKFAKVFKDTDSGKPVEVSDLDSKYSSAFSFTIASADGSPLPAVETVNNDGRNVQFGAIKFTQEGTYAYKVTENAYTDSKITIDSATITVTYVVSCDKNGVLSISAPTYSKSSKVGAEDDNTFVNLYNPDDVSLKIAKNVTGDAVHADKEFEFSVTINNEDGNSKTFTLNGKTVTGSGKFKLKNGESVTITGLHYKDSYTVTETVPAGYSNSNSVQTGGFTGEGDDVELTFNNEYSLTSVSATLPSVKKTLTGRKMEDKEFNFQISVSPTDGAELPKTTTMPVEMAKEATNNTGSVSFGNITFTKAGTYKVTFSEVTSAAAGITYAAPQTVTYNVIDDGAGNLVISSIEGIESGNVLNFTNAYTRPVISVEKTQSVNDSAATSGTVAVKEGDKVTFTMEVTNSADGSKATNVVLEDEVPSGLVIDPASVKLTKGTTVTPVSDAVVGNTVKVDIGELAGGEKAIVSFDVTVPHVNRTRSWTNTATVEYDSPLKEDGSPYGDNVTGDTTSEVESKPVTLTASVGTVSVTKTTVGTSSYEKEHDKFTFKIKIEGVNPGSYFWVTDGVSTNHARATLDEYGYLTIEEGVGTNIQLTDSHTIKIWSIPAGAKVTVTEEPLAGYTCDDPEQTVESVSTDHALTFTNTRNLKTLTVGKQLLETDYGADNIKDYDKDKVFTFNIKLSGIILNNTDERRLAVTANDKEDTPGEIFARNDNITDGKITFNRDYTATVMLKDGESVTISGIPEGAGYEITEEPTDGYEAVSDGSEKGTVGADNVNVTINNKKVKPAAISVEIPVVKNLVDGKGHKVPSLEGKEFTFRLTAESGNPASDPFAGGAQITVDSDSELEKKFTENFTDAGTYSYTLEEINGGIPNVNYSVEKYDVEVKVSEETKDGIFTGNYTYEVSFRKNGDASWTKVSDTQKPTFTNVYDKHDLTVGKTVAGRDGERDREWHYNVVFYLPTSAHAQFDFNNLAAAYPSVKEEGAEVTPGEVTWNQWYVDCNTYPSADPNNTEEKTSKTNLIYCSFTLKHGQTMTIRNLPEGTIYKVLETDMPVHSDPGSLEPSGGGQPGEYEVRIHTDDPGALTIEGEEYEGGTDLGDGEHITRTIAGTLVAVYKDKDFGDANIAYTNECPKPLEGQGRLNVYKDATGSADRTKDWKFRITMTSEPPKDDGGENPLLTYSYRINGSGTLGSVTTTHDQDKETLEFEKGSDGKYYAEITLKNGGLFTLYGLPSKGDNAAQFEITEEDSENTIKNGYNISYETVERTIDTGSGSSADYSKPVTGATAKVGFKGDDVNAIYVAFTNDRPERTLSVTKEVSGTAGDTTEFDFKLEVYYSDGVESAITDAGNTKDGYKISINRLTASDLEFTTEGGRSIAKFKLKNGDTAVIAGLPNGAKYKVTENHGADYQNTEIKVDDVPATSGEAEGQLDHDPKVVFTNVRNTAELKVKKVIKNADGKEVSASQQDEIFTVNLSFTAPDNVKLAGNYSYTVNGGAEQTLKLTKSGTSSTYTATLQLSHNETATISGLPVGTICSASEKLTNSDYTSEVSDSVTLEAASAKEITVTNTYHRPALKVTKSVTVGGVTTSDTSSGAIEAKDQEKITYTITVENVGDEGSTARNITVTDVLPGGLSAVRGSSKADNGTATRSIVGGVTTLTWHLDKDLNKGESATLSFDVYIPYVEENTEWTNTATASYDNEPEVPSETEQLRSNEIKVKKTVGSLTITKTVVDNDSAGEFSFNLQLTGDKIYNSYTVNGETVLFDNNTSVDGVYHEFTLGNGESLVVMGLDPDTTFILTENLKPQSGYTVKMNDLETQNITDTVENVSTVNVVNTYHPPVLTVTKTQSVNGAAATEYDVNVKPGDKIEYTITIENNGDKDSVVTGARLTDAIAINADLATKLTSKDITVTRNGEKIIPTVSISGDNVLSVGPFKDIGSTDKIEISYSVTVPRVTVSSKTWSNTASVRYSNSLSSTPVSSNTVTATERLNSLTVEKSVVRAGGSEIEDDGTYNFNITLTASDGKDITADLAGGTAFSLKNGDKKVITGIPDGTTYTITETPVEDYTTAYFINGAESSAATGKISGDTAVTVMNTYYKPDITVTKTQSVNGVESANINVQPGDEITYTVTVTSNGDAGSTARGIEISDKIPADLTISGDISATAGAAAESEGTITWTVGDLAVGETATMSYTVVVPVQTEDAKWTNTAVATFANNRDNKPGETKKISSNIVTATEKTWSLTVNKSVVGVDGAPIEDDDGTYEFAVTLTASNDKDITGEFAKDTTFSLKNGDEKVITGIPEGTTYKIVETPVEDYTTKYKIGGEDVTVEAAGEVYAEGTFAGEDIEIIAENTHHLPKVTLIKLQKLGEQDFTADDLNVRSGDKVTYKLTVKNEGDEGSTARDITVTDVIPEGLTVGDVTGAEYDVASRTLTWKISELDVNKTEELEYTVTVPYETASKSWTNTASAKFKNDPKTTKKTASVKITESVGSLKVSKSVVEDPLYDGEAFTVNISLTDGAEPFDGTFDVDSGYEDTKDDSVDGGKITFTGGKATVKLADKESITILGIPVGIGYEVAEALDSDDYTVKYSESESGTISDGAESEVEVVNTYIFPEISIVKTGEVLPDGIVSTDGGVTVVKPGAEVSYTIKVTNNGENAAENVVVTDKLEQDFAAEITSPSDISVDKKDGVSVTVKDGVITVTIESLEPGETVTAEFKVTIPEISGVTEKSWTNSATVVYDNDKTPDPSDPDPVPKTSETDPLTEKLSDLTVNLESVYADGSDFDDAEEFNLSLKFSTGREYEAEDGTKSGSFALGDGGSVTFKNVPVGVDYTLTESDIGEDYTVKGAEIVSGSATAAKGSISESGSTANVTNVYHKPNITVTKTQSVNGAAATKDDVNVQPGNEITYTVTVTSNGDAGSTTRGIEISDKIPDGLKLDGDISATAGTTAAESGGTITWTVGDLAVGKTATMTYTVTVPVETTATEWSNTAVATFENNRDNTTAKEEIPSNTVTAAETTWSLTVEKSVIGVDGDAIADDDGTYEFNIKLTASDGADITEKLTAETFSLANGKSKEITGIPDGTTYTITENPVADYTTAYIINGVESSTATGEISGDTSVTVVNTYYRPDITVTKTQSVNSAAATKDDVNVQPGNEITYTVTVTSNGDEGSVARGIEISDVIPDGLKLDGDISATAGAAAESGGTITWTVGDLEVGKTATMTYTVTVPVETTATEWSNTAVATFENNRDNTTAKEEIPSNTVTAAETTWSLTVNKSVIGVDGVPIEDDDGTYEFNIKLTASNGEDITEKLAGDKTFSLKNGENVVIEGIPDGTTYTITENPVADYTTAYIINGVESSTATGEISGDTSVTVVNTYYRPDITVTKTQSVNGADPTKDTVAVKPGDKITYTVTVTSNGDEGSVARGVKLSDKLHPDFVGKVSASDVEVSAAGAQVEVSPEGVVTVDLGDMPAGSTADVTFSVNIPLKTDGASGWTNSATAVYDNNRDNPAGGYLEITSNEVVLTEKTADLEITLKVENVDGTEADTVVETAEGDKQVEFDFVLDLLMPDGTPTKDEFAYSVVQGDIAVAGEGTIKSGTKVTLYNGGSIIIHNVPEGIIANVTEILDSGDNYTVKDSENKYEFGETLTLSGDGDAIEIVNVYHEPIFDIDKSQDVSDVKPGGTITYFLFVDNSSEDPDSHVRNVELSDILPVPDLTYRENSAGIVRGRISSTDELAAISPEDIIPGSVIIAPATVPETGEPTVELIWNGEDNKIDEFASLDFKEGYTVYFTVDISPDLIGERDWRNIATARFVNHKSRVQAMSESAEAIEVETENSDKVEVYLGSLAIEKEVSGIGVAPEDLERDYGFSVEFDSSNVLPEDVYDLSAYPYIITSGDGSVIESGEIPLAGGRFTLSHGERIEITSLPKGLEYKLTEDHTDGFDVYGELVTYDIKEPLGYSGSVFGGKIEDVSGSVILVRNDKLEKRKLTVSKTVSGMNADQTLEFSFGIIFTDSFGNPLAGPFESVKHTALGDVPALVSSGQSFTLRHGESMEITGLATYTVYTVTEPDVEILGYSSNIGAVGSGTVGRNDITIEVNNVKLPEKGQLAVTVDVAGTSKFVPEIKQNSFFGISVSLDGAAAGQQFFYRIFEPGKVAVTAAEPLYTVPGGFTESGIIPSADLFAEASPEGEAQTAPEPDVSENLGEAEGEEQNAPALETLDPNLIPFTGQIALKYGQTAVIYGLPDGTTYNVTQISADIGVHYTTEYDGCSGIIAGSAGSVAKILNTVNAEGNLTVKNDTVGADVPFEITVTLTDSTISSVYGEMEFIDGVARFSLTSGQSLTAAGLPEGTQYTVDIAENPDYTTEMSGDLGPIVETVTNVVSFKNTERGALTLEKTAKGFALAGTEYSFTITLTDKNGELLSEELGYTGPDGDGTFTGKLEIKLQAGETVKINRIPDGTHYLIEEDVYEGYIVEKFNEEGVIVYGQTTAAGFVNIKTAPTYPPEPPAPVTPVTPDEPDTPDNPDNPDEPDNPDDSEGLPEITIPTPIEPKFESAVEEKSFAAGLAAIAGGLAKLATR